MTELVRITIDDRELQAGLRRLEAAGHDLTPAMRKIAATLANVVEDNFAAQGRPTWTPSVRARDEGGMTLQHTGRLASSIDTQYDAASAVIGSNVAYARIHQLGGETPAHVIRPTNKRALAFGGHVVKSVNHPGSKIPARPYLPVDAGGALQPQAGREVLDAVLRHLTAAAGV